MIRWSSKIVRHASPTTTTTTSTATSSGDMHHPRHRFITAVGTGSSPRSFLVSSKHTTVCLDLSLSFCLSSFLYVRLLVFPCPSFFLPLFISSSGSVILCEWVGVCLNVSFHFLSIASCPPKSGQWSDSDNEVADPNNNGHWLVSSLKSLSANLPSISRWAELIGVGIMGIGKWPILSWLSPHHQLDTCCQITASASDIKIKHHFHHPTSSIWSLTVLVRLVASQLNVR